jgi:hypothetical protein
MNVKEQYDKIIWGKNKTTLLDIIHFIIRYSPLAFFMLIVFSLQSLIIYGVWGLLLL